MNILVVDDLVYSWLFLSNIIEFLGHTGVQASTREEFVEYISEYEVDAVIMDYDMPSINATEMTTYIKEVLNMDIPVATLTSNNSDASMDQLKNAGVDYIIAKPICIEKIADFFNETLTK